MFATLLLVALAHKASLLAGWQQQAAARPPPRCWSCTALNDPGVTSFRSPEGCRELRNERVRENLLTAGSTSRAENPFFFCFWSTLSKGCLWSQVQVEGTHGIWGLPFQGRTPQCPLPQAPPPPPQCPWPLGPPWWCGTQLMVKLHWEEAHRAVGPLSCEVFPEHRVSHSWFLPWNSFRVCWRSVTTEASDFILLEPDSFIRSQAIARENPVGQVLPCLPELIPSGQKLCDWQGLGAPAGCQAWASVVGEPSSGHWSTKDLPAPFNIKQLKPS